MTPAQRTHCVFFSPLSSLALSSLLMCLSAWLDLFPPTRQGWNLYFSWAHQCGFSFKWKINEEIKDGCLVVSGRTLCWHWDSTGMCFWRLSLILMLHREAKIWPLLKFHHFYAKIQCFICLIMRINSQTHNTSTATNCKTATQKLSPGIHNLKVIHVIFLVDTPKVCGTDSQHYV